MSSGHESGIEESQVLGPSKSLEFHHNIIYPLSLSLWCTCWALVFFHP